MKKQRVRQRVKPLNVSKVVQAQHRQPAKQRRVAPAAGILPAVTGIVPSAGSKGGGTSVTVTGTAFTGATDVSFGPNSAQSINIDSDSQITAVSPNGTGTVDVTVTTANGTSNSSVEDQFTFGDPPIVDGINPASGPMAGGTIVIITGSGLTGATGVSFGTTNSPNMSVDSDSLIAAISPPGVGMADVCVTTAFGTSAKSANDQFSFTPTGTLPGGYRAPSSVSVYAGILPYDSEIFGVYRPLLNWYGYQATVRTTSALAQTAVAVIKLMAQDPNLIGSGAAVKDPVSGVHLQVAKALQSNIAARVADAASQVIARTGRPPTVKDWRQLLAPNFLNQALSEVIASGPQNVSVGAVWPAMKGLGAAPSGGGPGGIPTQVQTEIATANFLTWAANHSPDTLNALFLTARPPWRTAMNFISPFGSSAGGGGQLPSAVLSPVGLINLYREYFYELDTFLGPPTGHVWVSPGGSLELYEISTRKTTVTKTVETSTTQTAKDEVDTTDQDELSTAVKTDNKNDTKLGVSANAGGSFLGIVHADASASFSSDSSVETSSELAHKHSRTQSEKLSKEITQNFKTTFQTVTETTDTTSRRYVLANNTDTLANYELRRKMRLIGVQLQHIGTRLSWQVYVPNPASLLGVGEFVPAPTDNSAAAAIQPPAPLDPLKPQSTDFPCLFPATMVVGPGNNSPHLESDYQKLNDDALTAMGQQDNYVLRKWPYSVAPPDTGYTLAGITMKSFASAGGGGGVAKFSPDLVITDQAAASFEVRANWLNFNSSGGMNLDLTLNWQPPINDPRLPAYQAAYQIYQTNLAAAQLQDYVNATRTLVNVTSKITPRLLDGLRYEERDAIYRQLYATLSQVPISGGDPNQSAYITAEYIRELFDVDQMLYYVEPDYYLPRTQPPTFGPTPGTPSAGGDMLSAPGATASSWPRRPDTDYYLITEDSQPAPQGASLGWTIQLDGDDRRNQFLNAAWVKAVIPIQPGREVDALAWLQNENVEGVAGLNAPYVVQPGDPPGYANKTVGQVLNILASQLAAQNTDITNTLSTETVFEKGFDPLADGIKLDPTVDFKGDTMQPYQMFDFWLEVLPTDQIVAVDYDPAQHGA